jgi:hypothetical protein
MRTAASARSKFISSCDPGPVEWPWSPRSGHSLAKVRFRHLGLFLTLATPASDERMLSASGADTSASALLSRGNSFVDIRNPIAYLQSLHFCPLAEALPLTDATWHGSGKE